MQHIVRFKTLHQAISDQLVVFGGLQMFRYSFESHEKAIEIFELIELFDGTKRSICCAVALHELQQSERFDGAFEMQVQFGLGKREDEGTGHGIHDVRFGRQM